MHSLYPITKPSNSAVELNVFKSWQYWLGPRLIEYLLNEPKHYEETNTDNEFEIDWDKVYGMDQWSRKLISEGKIKPPMKKKHG